MVPFNILVLVCVAYVVFLFLVAFAAEQSARAGRLRWLRSSAVYTLSLSIYCTAWTFYGAVGYAARSGLEFVTIYLGPTLVFAGWWLLLRKLVRVGRVQRITSIADAVSSRFGKSTLLGVIVTVIAVVAATPYIALQLQSVTLSFSVFATATPEAITGGGVGGTAPWVAGGLALFTILFGTRTLDAREQHHGVVGAIAVEAVVKLVALLAVGIFVVWGVASGPADIFARVEASSIARWDIAGGRWAGITFLSALAIFCLPRMFQVIVVENTDERHLATASWAFPLYLLLMSLFILPIAVVGLEHLPADANPDLFVLTLPLSFERGWLAMLAFLGGFSSATSMVIVAAIALSTMVSNHILMPLWLRLRQGEKGESGDVRGFVLMARRLSIAGVLALGYFYYRLSGAGESLAAIGLISFVGVAQVAPALLGGLYWRGATRMGAAAGLLTGFAIWIYTLFLPSMGPAGVFPAGMMEAGPFGIGWLRPQALFGAAPGDPLLHALFWSLSLNSFVFATVSLLSFPGPVERVQGVEFVRVFDSVYDADFDGGAMPARALRSGGAGPGGAEVEDLLTLARRILGPDDAQDFFTAEAEAQGIAGFLPEVTPRLLERLELRLAGAVGAATAHSMIGQIAGRALVSVEDLMAMANETQQIIEYSSQLEAKSDELVRTARQLSAANEKLTALSIQKDAFLGQISHELRTPMTSIRAFSEILIEGGLTDDERARYAVVIHDEAIRLTRLLDDLLDLAVLEHGQVQINRQVARLDDLIDRAVMSAGSSPGRHMRIRRDPLAEAVTVTTDTDRLTQVFINLIANARKYCDAPEPELRIEVRRRARRIDVDFIDNGHGIPREKQGLIFEKFFRISDLDRAGGAGLGLAICREIMERLGGTIAFLPGQGGAAFRVGLPLRPQAGRGSEKPHSEPGSVKHL